MICSVIIPSRSRPAGLCRALHSLTRTVNNILDIEIIVGLDNDDHKSISQISDFEAFPQTRVIVGDRIPVPQLTSNIAQQCKGDWILVFNDDAEIIGSGWDRLLSGFPTTGMILQPEIYQINLSQYYHADRTGFPFFPNRCWDTFKCSNNFIPHPCDFVSVDLAYLNGWKVGFLDGIKIFHNWNPGETE